MAWKEVQVLEQRKLFIKLYIEDKLDMATLCNQFGISRPSGYKWVERYEKEGFEGLADRSRAPINQALAIDPVLKTGSGRNETGSETGSGRTMGH